ncbi:MAG: hypothetical protein ACT443_14755, partial [Gemmatimonadota bacterium]
YRRIPAFTRTDLHRRAADVLRRKTRRVGEVAEHYYKARQRTLAFNYSLMAIADADARHAVQESISFLKLAVKASRNPPLTIRQTLAERLLREHRVSESRRILAPILSSSQTPQPDLLRAQVLDLEVAYRLGELDGHALRQRLEERKQQIEDNDTALRIQTLRLQLRSAYHDGDARGLGTLVQELREFAAKEDRPEGIEALAYAARVHSLVHSSIEAEQWALPVWSAIDAIEDYDLKIALRLLISAISYEVGKLTLAEDLHRKLLAEIDGTGAISQYPLAAMHTHMLLVEQGKYAEATRRAAQIRQKAAGIEGIHVIAPLSANEASMFYELGDYGKAEAAAADVMDRTTRTRTRAIWIELGATGIRGLVALEGGQLSQAKEYAEHGRSILAQFGKRVADISHLEILISRIDTLLHGREKAAQRLSEAVAEYAHRDVVCRLRMQYELAWLFKQSDRAKARALANQVFNEARSINASPIAERADSLLHRL